MNSFFYLTFLVSLFYSGSALALSCSDIVTDDYRLRDATYICNDTLVVPEGVTLQSRSSEPDRRGQIVAGVSFPSNSPLILLQRDSSLKNVIVNGAFRPRILVQVRPDTKNSMVINRDGFENDVYGMQITNNLIINAYNGSRNYPLPQMNGDQRIDLAGIYIKAAGSRGLVKRINIANNVIKNIGFKSSGSNQGKAHPSEWPARAHAIWMRGVLEVHIRGNTLSHTLGGGVNFGGCRDVVVEENIIRHTGLARLYDVNADYVSDGITAYKNRSSIYGWIYSYRRPERFVIVGNEVTNSHNNGIHVSGNSLIIEDNIVRGQRYRGIYYGHWNEGGRITEDPMNNTSFKNNDSTQGFSSRSGYTAPFFVRRPPSGARRLSISNNHVID